MFDKLIDLLISSLKLFQFFFTVNQYEETVVLRFGKFHRIALPGFHWHTLRAEFHKIASDCGAEVVDVRVADMTRSRSIRLLQAK